jgi:protein SCO1/2
MHAALALALLASLVATPALAAEHPDGPSLKRATRSLVDVTLPSLVLTREDGKSVGLAEELGDGRPVVLTFIFTKCGTICPVMSQTFSRLQARFAERHDRVHLISISIDPEYDTPARLAEYASRQQAGPQWHFYTGSVEATRSAQQAFQAYRGDKMSHTPVTFLRASAGSRWERVDGFASPEELLGELHHLIAAR